VRDALFIIRGEADAPPVSLRRSFLVRAIASLIAVVGVLLSFSPAPAAAAAGVTAAQKERALAARPLAKRPFTKRTAPRRAARRAPYGFLPGYRSPEFIERQQRLSAASRPFYALPWARFHRGRWNGGGFGPCYTYTPIGPVWNCGR
jgi:hypothetical protein